jgi:hypothetical protein
MAIDFSNRVMVTNPTFHFLGKTVFGLGIAAIATGVVTNYAGEFVLPPPGWFALSVPTLVTGGIFYCLGLTRS